MYFGEWVFLASTSKFPNKLRLKKHLLLAKIVKSELEI